MIAHLQHEKPRKNTLLGYQTYCRSACRRIFNQRSGTSFYLLEYPCSGYLEHLFLKNDTRQENNKTF